MNATGEILLKGNNRFATLRPKKKKETVFRFLSKTGIEKQGTNFCTIYALELIHCQYFDIKSRHLLDAEFGVNII